jgi:addiction module HigA family antidote
MTMTMFKSILIIGIIALGCGLWLDGAIARLRKRREAEAACPSPGVYIKAEIEARGWTRVDLARRMECSARTVSDIINGEHGIDAGAAHALAGAFGTSAEMWMNLQAAHDQRRGQVVAS